MGSDTNIIAASADRARRLARVRDLEDRRRAPPARRTPLHLDRRLEEVTTAMTRPKPTADDLDAAPCPLDDQLRLQRAAVAAPSSSRRATTSGRQRPRATARSTRCSAPSIRRCTRCSPGIRACSPSTSRHSARDPMPRAWSTVTIAPPASAVGCRAAGRYDGEARALEHRRRVRRGVHRCAQQAPRRGALGGRDRGRRQSRERAPVRRDRRRRRHHRAEVDQEAGGSTRRDWFNR